MAGRVRKTSEEGDDPLVNGALGLGRLIKLHMDKGSGQGGKLWTAEDLRVCVKLKSAKAVENWVAGKNVPQLTQRDGIGLAESSFALLLTAFGLAAEAKGVYKAVAEKQSQYDALMFAHANASRSKHDRAVAVDISRVTAPHPTPPIWHLPPTEIALTEAHRIELRRVFSAPVADILSFIAHRYAQLRLQPLGGDESGDHATFVNLRLQPVNTTNPALQQSPESFDSLAKMLAQHSGGAEPIWQLRGEPGAGKSTLLIDLELRCAEAALLAWNQDPSARPEVCVFVSLAGWDATATMPDVEAWVQSRWQDMCGPLTKSGGQPLTLADVGKRTRLRFLFDGLNEITVNTQAQRSTALRQLCIWAHQQAQAGHPAPVFSVRKLNYLPFPSGHGLPRSRVADVEPWANEQIQQYCDRRFPGAGNPLWRAIGAHAQKQGLLELFGNPFNLALQCQLFDPTQPAATLAANRGELMGRIALRRLNRALTSGTDAAINAPDLFDLDKDPRRIADCLANAKAGAMHQVAWAGDWFARVRKVALAVHKTNRGGWAEWGDKADVEAVPQAQWTPAILAAASLNIATEVAGLHRFSHQLWQEYFAACALACDDGAANGTATWQGLDLSASLHVDVPDGVWELPSPDPTFWDQCVQLAVQIADAKQANALLSHLLNVNLALAGRAALGRAKDVGPALMDEIKMALLKRSTDAGVELPLRIEAGLLLGKLGDDIRYVEGVGPEGYRYLLPRAIQPGGTLGFVPVPAGAHKVGGLVDDADSANVVDVTIAPSWGLAFSPVTRAEFECFVKAEGYGKLGDAAPPKWWQGDEAAKWWHAKDPNKTVVETWQSLRSIWQAQGAEWAAWEAHLRKSMKPDHFQTRVLNVLQLPAGPFNEFVTKEAAVEPERKPTFWDSPDFNNPSQPVVGVCFWAAQAYCRWLSHQTGREVRLPTEAEWEVAARGGGARTAHWPGETPVGPSAADVNQLDTLVRHTTPIGVFPGSTVDGYVDLCGQVWEWTSSACNEGALDNAVVNVTLDDDSAGKRAVRGGSWNDPSQLCRAAIRSGVHPDGRDNGLGFRLLVCPIQTPES
jgi:formylglycine-generating enzyme required for sulfatase activity